VRVLGAVLIGEWAFATTFSLPKLGDFRVDKGDLLADVASKGTFPKAVDDRVRVGFDAELVDRVDRVHSGRGGIALVLLIY